MSTVSAGDRSSPQRRWLLAAGLFLSVGLLWRLGRYLLDFPIWGDEAMVALNLPDRDFAGLLGQLDHCQVAPPLWLWCEKIALDHLGPSTLSLRLAPLIAGCAGLVAHAWLAWKLFPGRAGAMAIGLLAVAIWPVSMSTLIKPYSFDLLAAILLLVPASQALGSPHPARWMLILAILGPIAILASFPAMFVAGAVLLALISKARVGPVTNKLTFAAMAATILLSSWASIEVGHNQLESVANTDGVTTRQGMDTYWASGFPPKAIAMWVPWLLGAMTGQMMAYPVGASNGGSAVTAIAVVFGTVCLARQRKAALLVLLTAPVALNLVAALIHRYPFGSSGRLCQFLAPTVCLLAGLGADRLLGLLGPRWSLVSPALVALLAMVGLGGLARDYIYPYRDPVFVWMRSVMDDATTAAGDDPVAVRQTRSALECVFTWRWTTSKARVAWGGELPPSVMTGNKVWVFHQKGNPVPEGPSPIEKLVSADSHWKETTFRHWHYPSPRPEKSPPITVEMVLLERP